MGVKTNLNKTHCRKQNLTNRFHVAARLFTNRSQVTSKFGKRKNVPLIFKPHFDVFCDLLLDRRTATRNLLVSYNLSSEQPWQPKSLDVALNIAGVEKIRSENVRLWLTPEGIRAILVLNERSVSNGWNLCRLSLQILNSLWNSVGDTFQLRHS